MAQEDETQGILHGYSLRGLQGRGRESAAGQYGPDLQKNFFILNKTQSMCNLRVLFSLKLVDSNISETAFIAPFPCHSSIYCCVMTLAWIFFKDPARTLVEEETEERVN